MRLLEAEATLITDLNDESELIAELVLPDFTLTTRRHPTLGRLVIVTRADGSGAVVEADE